MNQQRLVHYEQQQARSRGKGKSSKGRQPRGTQYARLCIELHRERRRRAEEDRRRRDELIRPTIID